MSFRSEEMPFSVGAIGVKDMAGMRRVLLRASISRVVRDVAEGLTPLMHLRARPGSDVTRPRIVSTLSGASDLMIVEEGLAAGYDLWVILAKSRAETVAEIEDPAAHARLEGILGRAAEVSEPAPILAAERGDFYNESQMLGGPPGPLSRLLTASDLVICVWDGQPDPALDSPGTLAVAAAEQGVPVVWIESRPPHAIRLYGLSEPHPESWNRLLPPDVLERLERIATKGVQDHPSRP